MNFPSLPRRWPLRTDTAQSENKARANHGWSECKQGLDDETKTFDFPVEGEIFLLTSPFIERSVHS